MVKLFKLHKFFGLLVGLFLLVLGLTGFFINNRQWNFLYTTTVGNVPNTTLTEDKKLFEAYWVDSEDTDHIIVGGKRGIFETFDEGETYSQMTDLQCLAIKTDANTSYAATSDGIYVLKDEKWNPYALQGNYVNALSVTDKYMLASIDKHRLLLIKRDDASVVSDTVVKIDASQLQDDITLKNLIKDLHFGRGLLDGKLSALLNDYGALVLIFLSLSGYLVWWYIHLKKKAEMSRKLIKWHANSVVVLAFIPLTILAVTGIFLNHSGGLKKFMTETVVPHSVLPPVYSSLTSDIWSVDFDGTTYRIGNRYGVYKSTDLKSWKQETKGFAYRMARIDGVLYVSVKDGSNRFYDGVWKTLEDVPYTFKDAYDYDDEVKFFTYKHYEGMMPEFEDATLFSTLRTIHGGVFMAPWWKWINDFVAIALLILGFTGISRWIHKKRLFSKRTPKQE
ncbi:peptidase [Sulfurovum lithotrophicum]|uniref:Peptidase n=1 Tax=Sulfurovum lithotrophicum TaxID=206403 RepID=A0A7U4M1I3_9BACT|nr:PepSY-associated TM helix domain-containing protein [Sulfurovum lithotrophicum]AKF25150.1 peptidase [Sulfurovum lithotrophicum]